MKQGSTALRSWREEHPDEQLDLEEADLKGIKAPGANLDGANLRKANLEGAMLYDATLRRADLWGANLADANLLHVDFESADLIRTNLTGAGLGSANFAKARLWSANLHGAKIEGSDFADARLDDATGLHLLGTRNYVLDGLDISTWVIPPAPLWPRVFWPEDSRVERIPRWQFWRLRVYKPYSDPWNSVRRSYTGVMTAFHLLLAAAALGPYGLRAVLAEVGDYGVPRFAVALGLCRENAWFLGCTGILIVAYNLLRVLATWGLSQLREEETRSGRAPTKSQYWPFWLAHKWFLRWVGYFALVLGLWRTVWWLCERV